MSETLFKQSELSNPDCRSTQAIDRRRFLFTAAGVAGLWACRPALSFAAGASGTVTPGTVTIVQFSEAGKRLAKVQVARVVRSDAEWQQKLAPISYEVARRAGTEQPYSGATWNNHDHGLYRCVCCDNAVFSSETKFESGTGWPSFWQPIAKENVVEIGDKTFGMERVAVSCRQCDAHLGHVFDDGPQPTGLRYCMNSAAMRFLKVS